MVRAWMLPINSAISRAEAADRSASLRTSSATTAKPRPCSPARAASMAAFSASRLVCSAMPEITWVISPICVESCSRSRMRCADSRTTSRIRCIPTTLWSTTPAPVLATPAAWEALWVTSVALLATVSREPTIWVSIWEERWTSAAVCWAPPASC